jgi:hypothetical protein
MFFFSVLKLELSKTESGEKGTKSFPEKPSMSLSVNVKPGIRREMRPTQVEVLHG